MHSTDLKGFVSAFGLIGLAAMAPSSVFAQDASPADQATANATAAPAQDNALNGGEIIVTAQRRSEKQVDVPITITAINAQALATANVQTLSDISKLTPALRFDNAGGFYQPTIRGVGTPVTTSGGGTNVGIYIDGFYSPNPLANDFEFLNVENVQVLKGPQGTLFGHNTTGGAITVQTADPSTTTEVIGKVSYARFNTVRAQAYATTGLTQDIAFDIEGLYSRSDGYLTNVVDGNNKIDQSEDYTIRTGLKAQLTPDISVLLRYTHSHVNDPTPGLTASEYDPVFGSGAPYYAFTPVNANRYTYNPRQTAVPTGPGEGYFQHTDSDIAQGTIKADLGFANLTSYTQYRKETVNAAITGDYTAALAYGSNYPLYVLGLPNHNSTWSQEVLLTSKPGPRLQYTAGMFYFSNTDTYLTYFNEYFQYGDFIPPSRLGGSSTTTSNLSGFLDATYQLTDNLFLTGGARFSHDRVYDAYFNSSTDVAANPSGNPAFEVPVPSISSNHVTPRAVLRYKPDDHSSVYASFTEGYKAAIIDVGGSCQDASTNYVCNQIKPEKIDAFEVGYKYDSHRFTADVSAYYYNYKNLQVSEYLSGATAYIINAARSHIYGFDGQFTAKLDEHFDIQAGGAYTHARFVEFDNAPVFVNNGGVFSIANNGRGVTLYNSPMQRAPDFTGNVMLHYATGLAGGKLSLSSGLDYTSKIYFGPAGNQFTQNGYATLDARAQWTDPTQHYTLAVFGTNLTNEAYKTEIQTGQSGFGANWAMPVSYGVEFGVKF